MSKFMAKLRLKFVGNKAAQDIQDSVFRKMSVEKKISLASDFYKFAMDLNKLGRANESRGIIKKDRTNS